MSMLDGVSQCWLLSKTCVVDWDAIAALGGWVAATVTLFAVLLPYRQYQRERKERDLQLVDDARIQLKSLLPPLAEIYVTARGIPQHLNGNLLEEKFERSVIEWTKKLSTTPLPRIAWHPSIVKERDAVESLSICVIALSGYEIGSMSPVAQNNLRVGIANLDAAAGIVVRYLALIEPGLRLEQHFVDYFTSKPGPAAN